MPVTDVTHDLNDRTITITADFNASLERVWQVYADPRQLERVWGPPSYPATFVDHSLIPGGRMNYYMTSPEGEKYYGYWEIQDVNEPTQFTFEDGFANSDFSKNDELPVSENDYRFAEHNGGTRAVFLGKYATAEALQKVLDMGVIEGSREAINQVDTLLAS